MTINNQTASEYFRLAALAAERGNISEALRYGDQARERLERGSVEIEAPGTVIGESVRYDHLAHVIAEKRRLANAG